MKTYIRKSLVTVFAFICFAISFVPLEASENVSALESGKNFTIRNIIVARPYEKHVTLELDHHISYSSLIAWFKKDKPEILPKLDIDWNVSYTNRNQITLEGDFEAGKRYSLIFKPGFEIDGKRYKPTKSSFVIEPLSSIRFFNQKDVIEKNSKQLLHLNLKNINRFTVNSIGVPPVYLPYALDRSADWKKSLDKLISFQVGTHGEDLPEPFKELQGEITRDKKLFNFQKNYREKPFSIPLTHRKSSDKGSVQLIKVKSDNPDLEAETSYKLVRITDIGITYKRSSKNILVWLTSLNSGTPLKNQKTYALDDRSQLFFLGSTNSDGVIIIKPGNYKSMTLKRFGGYHVRESQLDLSLIKALIAVSKDDVAFIEIAKSNEFYPDGIKKGPLKSPQEYLKTHIFTDRGIYKPGDTVSFKGTLREYSDGRINPYMNETPLRIENPKGETVFSSNFAPNEFGTISGTLNMKSHFPMGTYTIFMGSEDNYVTTRTFELQEFRAPKHKTSINLNTEIRRDNGFANINRNIKYLKVKISGQYYVGGPLKNAQVRWKIFHGKSQFDVSGYENFRFGSGNRDEELIESNETVLDEKGNAEFSFPVGPMVELGKRSLVVVASVIDFDGRVATSKKVYQGKPDYLVGMSKHPKSLKAGMELPLRFAVLDKDGNQKNEGKVKVSVLRRGWNYIRKRNERGEVYWNYVKLWKKVFATEHEMGPDHTPFMFSNEYGGEFLITASFSTEGKTYTSGSVLNIEGGYESYFQRTKLNSYEKIQLISDQTIYSPDTTASIKLSPVKKSPVYLVTLEREDVLEYELLRTQENQPELKVPLTDAHAPNIHVSILGALPRKDFPLYPSSIDEGAPSFQYGAIKLQVLKESDNFEIFVNQGVDSITQNPSSRGTLQISVKDKHGTGKAVELAIGIIDEKVLALTNYKTPDLSSLSSIDIPLDVATSDIRSWISRQTPLKMIWNKPVTGGGGLEKSSASDTTLRVDFNPVAYFNPSVVTDSGGNAVIEYELPDSITSYRVYVVACDKGNGFGNLELPLIASKDFYLEPGLPRFFAVGDKFNFLVKAINNTETSSNLDFTFDSTDGLTLFPKDNEYFLNSIDSTQIEVGGEALTKGNASVQLAGRFGNKQDAVRLEIPVHSGHTIGTDVVIGSFKRNTRLSLPVDRIKDPVKRSTVIENSDFKLTVSKTPFIRMSGGMAYLLQYPYGCVEQTSSRLMPLVALKGLIDDGQIPGITSVDTDKFINAGIKRLLTMQTESGGFGYWPGNKNPHKMGTLYAMTALSLARKNGIAVPEENMQKSIAFIKNLLNSSEKLTENFTAFGSYVLSLNDAYDPSTSDLLRRIGGKSTEADMFRLLARYNSGYKVNKGVGNFIQRTFFNNKLNVMPPSELGEFNAKHRYKAVSLLAANSIDPNHPLAHKMAKSLINGMDDAGFWSSTSDTGWALFALGEFYKNQKTSKVPTVVFVSQEGQSQNAVLKDKAFSTIDLNVSRNLENSKLELKSSTQEPIYYSATLKYPRLDYAESGYSNGFHISKVIENQSGSGDIHVGDIVKVKVSVDVENLSYSKPYSYVVIDDPLPSGLVAINSAIKTEEIIDEKVDVRSYWNSDGTYKLVPNFVEFKDDRVLVFKDKMYWNGTYQYTYYARAIMEGDFVLPSTKAQLMYSPQVAGFTHKDRIKIYGR